MKNKYQEALDVLSQFEKPNAEEFGKEFVKVNTNLLQELVDKETPMKAKEEWVGGDDDDYIRHLCPKCNIDLYGDEYYCENCGQKLDWE